MLPPKVIHLIEQHGDEIVAHAMDEMRRDPEVVHFRDLPTAEIREWGRHILGNLEHWLAEARDTDMATRYEAVGKLRFQEDIPLFEAVRGLCLLKEKVLQFAQDHAMAKTSMDLYAEEEFENRVGRFFDLILVHVVRGYEGALRRAAHAG